MAALNMGMSKQVVAYMVFLPKDMWISVSPIFRQMWQTNVKHHIQGWTSMPGFDDEIIIFDQEKPI